MLAAYYNQILGKTSSQNSIRGTSRQSVIYKFSLSFLLYFSHQIFIQKLYNPFRKGRKRMPSRQREEVLHPTLDGSPCLEEKGYQPTNPLPSPQDEIHIQSDKFETLVNKSTRVLLKINGVFPFDFFPDTLVIDENKVNIIHRMFFYTDEVQSILVHNIKDVLVDRSLFFASLSILPDGYSEQWVSIDCLWKEDATRARRIIFGLIAGHTEGIDLTKVETPDFTKKVEALGAVN